MKGSIFSRLSTRLGMGFVLITSLAVVPIARAQITFPINPLSVSITSPTNGAVFGVGSDIPIDLAVKSFAEYVRFVAVYSGTNRLFFNLIDPFGPSQTNGTPWHIDFNWTNVQAGSYTLTAVVSNGLHSATSAPVTITVGTPSPVVTVVATDPTASMVAGDTGTFTVYRTGNTSNALDVFYNLGGSASNGIDYQSLGTSVTIPAGTNSAQVIVDPIIDPLPEPTKTVILSLAPSPLVGPQPDYQIGFPGKAVVTIIGTNSHPPFVSIVATDPIAVEPGTNRVIYYLPPTPFTNYFSGTNTATMLVRRFGPTATGVTNSDLTVFYNIGGTASNGVDYTTLPGFVTIPAGKTYALITINPLEDTDPSNSPPFSTVILSLTVPATVSNVPPPYALAFPSRAAAIILESRAYPIVPWRPIFPIIPIVPIVTPAVPPLGILPGATFHASFPGTNGMNYCVQVSTNLTDWTPVCTNTVVKDTIDFLDPDAGSFSNRFYRVIPVAGVPSY